MEQLVGLSQVCLRAAESGQDLSEELPPALEVLRGHCGATLAAAKRWQEQWRAQRAEAEAQRQAWIERPTPEDVDTALAEIRMLLTQHALTPAMLASLVRLIRTAAVPSAGPAEGPPGPPGKEGTAQARGRARAASLCRPRPHEP